MGILTLETNSSHASSSLGPAQRKTMSFRDKDEYRVGLGVFDIVLFPVRAMSVVSGGLMDSEESQATRQAEVCRCFESHFKNAFPPHPNWMIVNTRCSSKLCHGPVKTCELHFTSCRHTCSRDIWTVDLQAVGHSLELQCRLAFSLLFSLASGNPLA